MEQTWIMKLHSCLNSYYFLEHHVYICMFFFIYFQNHGIILFIIFDKAWKQITDNSFCGFISQEIVGYLSAICLFCSLFFMDKNVPWSDVIYRQMDRMTHSWQAKLSIQCLIYWWISLTLDEIYFSHENTYFVFWVQWNTEREQCADYQISHYGSTVEPLYNTIVFHQNTHKRHPIARP